MPTIASRVKPALFSTSNFTEMNTLAQQYNAVNLGQGKPDADTPSDIIQRLIEVSQAGRYNQYAPAPGTPALRQGALPIMLLASIIWILIRSKGWW